MRAAYPAGATPFEVHNGGTTSHAFELEGNGIELRTTPILPDSVGTLSVVLSLGEYEVYCPVAAGAHKQRGMRATLTINFGSVAHNVFFDNQPAGAPANVTGANSNVSKSLTFSVAGTYVYNCHIHPGMHGTVVVTAPTT